MARRGGVRVWRRSVFEPVPGTGHWASALLLDGNLGIGGDPRRLLRRMRELIRPGGIVLVELAGPGCGWGPEQIRLEHRVGCSDWFPWAVVAVDRLDPLLDGYAVADTRPIGGRWFTRLLALA